MNNAVHEPASTQQARCWTILLLAIAVLMLAACDEPTGIAAPKSSKDFRRENYQAVVTQLKDAGFTNIKTEPIKDLVTGWLTKDGSVERVSIEGDSDFSSGKRFPADALVLVSYHTFPDQGPHPPTAASPASSNASPSAHEPTPIPDAIIARENNKDLDALLKVTNMGDPRIRQFSSKYKGRTIAFDGHICLVSPHENYKTRFDFLLCAGDGEREQASGPVFKFDDVNIPEMHLSGSTIPDTLKVGQRVRIIAKVGELEEGLFFLLEPVETQIR